MPVSRARDPKRSRGTRRPLFLACTLLAFCSACVLANGCSLDFTVRPDPGDASADGATDVLVERVQDALAEGDAVQDGDAPSVDCQALRDEVEAKLKSARACTLASGHCQSTIKDQCECDVVIATPGSTAAGAYADAVARLKNTTCERGCSPSPGCPLTTNRNCLQKGAIVECYPP